MKVVNIHFENFGVYQFKSRFYFSLGLFCNIVTKRSLKPATIFSIMELDAKLLQSTKVKTALDKRGLVQLLQNVNLYG